MPEIDPMKEAEDEFLNAVSVAAKTLAQAVKREAARKVFAQMTMFDGFVDTSGAPVNVLKPYKPPTRSARARSTADTLLSRVIDYVKKHPGLRLEQINARLDTKTGDLARPITKAIAAGKLIAKGYGRSRKYYPGKKA